MAKSDLSWRDAIQRVMRDADASLHYTEITDEIVRRGHRRKLGATPEQSVNAVISTSIKTEGQGSPFRRTGRGQYVLRDSARPCSAASEVEQEKRSLEQEEAQRGPVAAFGMYWRRTAVDWDAKNAKLLGQQRPGATAVDFSGQVGVYLLYDGREVIYVGRSVERPLGLRLKEHTLDRLATRWDRFSWFGLRPVAEQGTMGEYPASFPVGALVPALEALLIEAVEPRQNRKRGDDFSAVEYVQAEDPGVERKRQQIVLEKLSQKI